MAECLAECDPTECEGSPDPMCALACPMECAMQTCVAEMTEACRPLAEALETCEEDNGCSEIEDEAQEKACTLSHCCDEVGAALGGE